MSAESARVVSARGPVAGRCEKRVRGNELMIPIGNVRATSESVAQAEGVGGVRIFSTLLAERGAPFVQGIRSVSGRFGPLGIIPAQNCFGSAVAVRGRPEPVRSCSGAAPHLSDF